MITIFILEQGSDKFISQLKNYQSPFFVTNDFHVERGGEGEREGGKEGGREGGRERERERVKQAHAYPLANVTSEQPLITFFRNFLASFC